MQTSEIAAQEKKAIEAVMQLRKTKHDKGLPFMICSETLPSNQCYLEYSDGRILLVAIQSACDRDFTLIRELTLLERDKIRNSFLN